MAKRTTGSITPGRIRKVSAGISRTQPVFIDDDDDDDFDFDENVLDANFPMVHNAPFDNQQQRRSSTQQPNQNKNMDVYFTPQIKRKRIPNQVEYSSSDSLQQLTNMFKDSLNELNRKVDMMNQREAVFEKKFQNMEKHLTSLARTSNKLVRSTEPPRELPPLEHGGRNLFMGPIGPTPAHFMKQLINNLFTKDEIASRAHEEMNERTTKILKAIQIYFYEDNEFSAVHFWENEGKVVRENQRRGHIFRNKLLPGDDI